MDNQTFYAHQGHKLADHLNEVGRRAAEFARAFDSDLHGLIAGKLHDLGKAESEFQKRLATNDREGEKQPHAHHGAMVALEKEAWPIALAINGHHAGLHNRGKLLEKRKEYLAKAQISARSLTESDSSWMVPDVNEAIPAWLSKLSFNAQRTSEGWLAVELFTRLLFSALIDADRLDTEEHERHMDTQRLTPEKFAQKWGENGNLRQWPGFDPQSLLAKLTTELTWRSECVGQEGRASANVLKVRQEVGEFAKQSATQRRGLFSLTVPTGGGKTLASMLFALAHAEYHNSQLPPDSPRRLRRIIVVIPYLSIIEQTARELSQIFGTEMVLEHHSQAEESEAQRFKAEQFDGPISLRAKRHRFAAENWDAPIIVTTSVQFFGSLFSRKTSKARKLHNICQSIVIFDEVQTLPPPLLRPLLDVLRELSDPDRPYGCSMVFCTATQPALEYSTEDRPYGLKDIRPIVPQDIAKEHFRQLARVTYHWPNDEQQRKSWDEIANEMTATPNQQALAIVNIRRHARELHTSVKRKLSELELGGDRASGLFHLSTWMMPSHRRKVLTEVRQRLEQKERCLLVSTQCIEAGVDVDFPEAWRAFGPYDAIVQAAGRCNRHGLLSVPGSVHIFRPEDEKYPPGLYQTAAAETESLKRMGLAQPENPDSFTAYFRGLYQLSVPGDCPIQKARAQWHFEEVHQTFKFIEDNTISVLILSQTVNGQEEPTTAKAIYDQAARRPDGGFFIRDDWRKLQACLVNLPYHNLTELQKSAMVTPAFNDPESGVWVWQGGYDGGGDGCGLNFETIPIERMIL